MTEPRKPGSLYIETLAQNTQEWIAWADAEIERLRAYADKLAAGFPEGMLPADVENLREANVTMAAEIERLRAENSS